MKIKITLILSLLALADAKANGLESNLTAQENLRKIQEAQEKMAQDQSKQKKALNALYQINNKIRFVVADRSKVASEILTLEYLLKENEKKLMELENEKQLQRQNLKKRVKLISRISGSSLLEFFLNSTSSSEMERNIRVMTIVAKKDADMIRQYRKLGRELEAEKEKIKSRLAKLEMKKQQALTKEKVFQDELQTKNNFISSLKKSKLFTLSQIKDLKLRTKEMNVEDAGILDSLLKASFFEQKGLLSAPILGPVMASFGYESGEKHSYRIKNKGLFFAAPPETPVSAVFDGTVSFAGPIPGFGQTVILDHGDFFFTVYSQNKVLKVKEGEMIKSNQKIALSGFDYRRQQSGLYFEIRHFSEPTDPMPWMKGIIQ